MNKDIEYGEYSLLTPLLSDLPPQALPRPWKVKKSKVKLKLQPDIDTWCAWAWLSSSWLLWRRSPRRSPWWSYWSSGWPCCWWLSSLEAGSRMRQPWPEITFFHFNHVLVYRSPKLRKISGSPAFYWTLKKKKIRGSTNKSKCQLSLLKCKLPLLKKF